MTSMWDGSQSALVREREPRQQTVFGSGWLQFAGVEVERFDHENGSREIAMTSYPGMDRRARMLIASTNCEVRVESAKLHFEANAEQGVVELLAELMQSRMAGADAHPEDARRTFLRKRPHALQRQDKRFNAQIGQAIDQCICRRVLDLAQKTQGDVKLFDRCPADIPQRRAQGSDRRLDRWRRRNRDE